MDSSGRIYFAPDDEIPAEDKARLDGYLRGRADADAAERLKKLEEVRERQRKRDPERS